MINTRLSTIYANGNVNTPIFDELKCVFEIEYYQNGHKNVAFAYNITSAWSKYLSIQKMLERSFERQR